MYTSVTDLPKNIQSAYSDKALEVYMKTFNTVFESTKNEPRAIAAAKSAAGKIEGMTEAVPIDDFSRFSEAVDASFFMDGTFNEVENGDGVHRAKVTIIKPGLSKNKYLYREDTLSALVPLLEGAKAYANHEKKSEIKDRGSRSIRDLMGWYEGVKQEEDGSITGVLNFVPGNDNIVEALKLNPSLMGLSINARGKASRGKANGENIMIAESFDKVYSTDLVTEAAAGGEFHMVASVTMDVDNKEDFPMEEKELAIWLIAEKDQLYKEAVEKQTVLETRMTEVEWYKAEDAYNVGLWLEAEEAHLRESKIEEAPEQFRDYLRESGADVEKFLEALKREPGVITNAPPATEVAKPKPGEAGFTRTFF